MEVGTLLSGAKDLLDDKKVLRRFRSSGRFRTLDCLRAYAPTRLRAYSAAGSAYAASIWAA